MERLQAWLRAQFVEEKAEPNSGLGEAITYLLKHSEPLTLSFRQAGAPSRNGYTVLVQRLDRWGRSLAYLVATPQELERLGVGFVSLTEPLDLTTPSGRAMAGMLAVFAESEREILRERVRASLAHARQSGKRLGRRERRHGRPPKCGNCTARVSVRPKSLAGCRLPAPRSGES